MTTTGKTVEEATDMALDQLGIDVDEAEIEVLEEPRSGLFGRTRGEARIRARVRPTEVRPKRDTRRRERRGGETRGDGAERSSDGRDSGASGSGQRSRSGSGRGSAEGRSAPAEKRSAEKRPKEDDVDMDQDREPVDPAVVGAAAVTFMEGLVEAFGASATVELTQDDTELEVRVNGSDLGLLVGPGGRTLTAVQDLARVAAQRRLGDHDTHLRIDVAGYRERRTASLQAFARKIAAQVRESGKAVAIEPMASPDRKVIHDVLSTEDGVTTRSQGEDPNRRVIVSPAD
ncbi:MAG: RNA-binding cell elongation regulator Jag/EloR [Ilumatobacteraceae bacterium]